MSGCTCYVEDFDNTGIHCLWCRWTALFCLASNLNAAAMLERAFSLGGLCALQWVAREPIYPTWHSGIQPGLVAPDTEKTLMLYDKVNARLAVMLGREPKAAP